MRSSSFGRLLVATVLVLPSAAFAAFHETGASNVTFTATGTMGLRLEGRAHHLTVRDDGTTVTVTVPLTHVTTGIDLRDEHTRAFLDVAHHPNATLTVPRSALAIPSGAATQGDAHGTMTIHGQSHDVAFHYSAEPGADGIHVRGTTRVDVRHYGLEAPSYLGVHVNPDVAIHFDFHVQDS